MTRILTRVLISLSLALPCSAAVEDQLAILEAAAQQDDHLQPGLKTYQVTGETPKIAEMIQSMTANMLSDMPPSEVPVITKYWLQGAPRSLIVVTGEQSAHYVAQMVERFSTSLAVELNVLLPADKLAERRGLMQKATVKSTEVALADNLLQRFEITFPQPTDIDQAFY